MEPGKDCLGNLLEADNHPLSLPLSHQTLRTGRRPGTCDTPIPGRTPPRAWSTHPMGLPAAWNSFRTRSTSLLTLQSFPSTAKVLLQREGPLTRRPCAAPRRLRGREGTRVHVASSDSRLPATRHASNRGKHFSGIPSAIPTGAGHRACAVRGCCWEQGGTQQSRAPATLPKVCWTPRPGTRHWLMAGDRRCAARRRDRDATRTGRRLVSRAAAQRRRVGSVRSVRGACRSALGAPADARQTSEPPCPPRAAPGPCSAGAQAWEAVGGDAFSAT